MISKLVTICGKEYLAKYPVGALIMAERKLGFRITEIVDRKSDLSFSDLSTLVRYGLHHMDGTLISDTEYEEIINNVDMTEFTAIIPEVLSAFGGGTSQASAKN